MIVKKTISALLISFLLIGCTTSNNPQDEKIVMLKTYVESLKNENTRLIEGIKELQSELDLLDRLVKDLQSNVPNRFADKVYYCLNNNYGGVYSILFIESDIIKVYSGKDEHGNDSTVYYRVEEYDVNTFRIIGDVQFKDSDPSMNFEMLQTDWANDEYPKLKVIEVTEDKNTLYFGNHSFYECQVK
jgi:hypothetical protein